MINSCRRWFIRSSIAGVGFLSLSSASLCSANRLFAAKQSQNNASTRAKIHVEEDGYIIVDGWVLPASDFKEKRS